MAETEYGIIKAKEPEFPIINLIVVPHMDGNLTASYPAFGTNYFKANIDEMQKSHSHPRTGERISFREPITAESISAAAFDFGNLAKPLIFEPSWLQLGYIVRTSEGVFANPPKDADGNPIIDEQTLKSLLGKAEKVNGICLGNMDFGFAPYETFNQGVQNFGDFARSGLARLLEHSRDTAKNLGKIASPEFYKRGVNVFGFGDVKEPLLRVASLVSDRYWDGRLGVSGGDWDDGRGGFAFGVLNETSKAGSQKELSVR
jgi:hypothetical protein